MSYWASETEWPMVRHSREREKKKVMFRKSETSRVAGGQKSLLVVAVCQCQNKWV